MKRYWKLLTLAGAVLLGIGLFYGYQAVNATRSPQMVVETVEGSDEHMQSFRLDATLMQQNTYENLSYQNGETQTESDLSIFEQLDGNHYLEHQIVDYRHKYRSFMRGKNPNLAHFAETDTSLFYVEVPFSNRSSDRVILLEKLDKETGETTEWTLPAPIDNPGDAFFVMHMYVKEDAVQLLFNQSSMQQDAIQDDFMVYEFDPQTEELSFLHSITPASYQSEGISTYVTFLPEMSPSKNRRFVPFLTAQMDADTGVSVSEEDPGEFFVYDFEEEALSSVTSDEPLPSVSEISAKGSRLYFYTWKGNALELRTYNMEAGAFEDTHTLDAGDYAASFEAGYFTAIDDHNQLYVVNRFKTPENAAWLLMFDLDTGEWLYAGEITLEEEPQGMYELYLEDFGT